MTKYLDPIMFADNTNLFYSHKNIKTLFQIVNSELKLVNEWFLANKLSLNAKKKKKCFISLSVNVWFSPVAAANYDIQ